MFCTQDAPDAVFLGHGTEMLSVFHLPWMSRSFSANPYEAQWWMYILWPVALIPLAIIRLVGKALIQDKYRLGTFKCEVSNILACHAAAVFGSPLSVL